MKLQKIEPRQIFTPQSQCGFTLIELLIAMVILSIGMLGTASLTTGIIRGNFFSKNITSATAIAQTQLEAVQREGYVNATETKFPSSAETVSIGVGGMNFSRTTTIDPDTPAANMKRITVAVTWNEANNAARSVNLQTILAQ
jgi:prepilin-type N-terminal cleavage/methylation domain-containing protein